jgi:GT2 family glycosyltransferase
LPETLDPLSASIVIPNYNGRHLLQKHLPQVISAAKGAPIIVVDDASTDDSVAFLQTNYPTIVIVQNQKNARFAHSCNQGFLAAQSKIIILLNNDVSPSNDLLSYLLPYFEDERTFAVGCLEVDDQGVESGKAGMRFSRGIFSHWRSKKQTSGETAWVSGGSGAFSRDIWLKLGGMDTLFAPAYEEDRDISYRAMKQGYKVLFEAKAKVAHHHESTNRTALGITVMRIASHKNQLLFIWKNVSSLRMLLAHLLFLPYHLVFSSLRSNGLFLVGFLWALTQLPQVLYKRSYGKMSLSDRAILQRLEKL